MPDSKRPAADRSDPNKTLLLVAAMIAVFLVALYLLRRAAQDVSADRTGASRATAVAAPTPPREPPPIDAAPAASLAPTPSPIASMVPTASPTASISAVASATKPTCVPTSKKELCFNGVDDNCDGRIDEGCPRR